MNKSFSTISALFLLSAVLGATTTPVVASPEIVHVMLQPKSVAYFVLDGVTYIFWAAVVDSSPYGTGNMAIVFKNISVNVYNFSVFVASENLLLGEKYGWLTSLMGNGIVIPGEYYNYEGVQSASVTIEETDINLTATVSGPISLSITCIPYGNNWTAVEDPDDSPYLYDYDGDGFWSFSTRRACNASGSFNGYQLGPANFSGGAFDIIDNEWYDLDIIPEFPSFLTLPIFMITTVLAAIVYRRKFAIQG